MEYLETDCWNGQRRDLKNGQRWKEWTVDYPEDNHSKVSVEANTATELGKKWGSTDL